MSKFCTMKQVHVSLYAFSFVCGMFQFFGPLPVPEGTYDSGSVYPSFLMFFCPEVFLGLAQFFLKLSMMSEAHVMLCVTTRFFE